MIGNENRTCQTDGWTGKQPQCLIDWCPDPPLVPGSTVLVNGKRAGSTAVYDCEKGFVLIGEPVSDSKIYFVKTVVTFVTCLLNRFYLVDLEANGLSRQIVDLLIVDHQHGRIVAVLNC